jgi:hypothetical protein
VPARPTERAGYPVLSLRFDLAIALLALWVTTGLYLDGWYHNTYQDQVETFMTPWHGVLYSGVLAAGAVLVLAYVANFRRGHDWRRALPPPYLAHPPVARRRVPVGGGGLWAEFPRGAASGAGRGAERLTRLIQSLAALVHI